MLRTSRPPSGHPPPPDPPACSLGALPHRFPSALPQAFPEHPWTRCDGPPPRSHRPWRGTQTHSVTRDSLAIPIAPQILIPGHCRETAPPVFLAGDSGGLRFPSPPRGTQYTHPGRHLLTEAWEGSLRPANPTASRGPGWS